MGLGIIIGGISLYRSYALYEEEKEYNVLKGQIPDFGYDVKFAVTVDKQKSDNIPGRQDNNGNYYDVKVSCTNGTTVGEWDYNAWNVKLDDISDGSKCTLAFTGDMSKEDYQKYIEEGIATRRNTYRGKDLTEFFTKHKEEFYKQIEEGTFDDIYVGDYIVSNQTYDVSTSYSTEKIIWLIADIDNYLHSGSKELTQHHLTIIPALPLMSAKMNETNDTSAGYVGSKMYTTTLNEVYTQYIAPDFETGAQRNHIIEYSNILTNKVNDAVTNRNVDTNGGASSSSEWVYNRKLDLMSEINVYGTIVTSSSYFDTGIDNRQYAIFQLKPEFINYYGKYRYHYWLKDVASSSSFAVVNNYGDSCAYLAGYYMFGVRPRFLIG